MLGILLESAEKNKKVDTGTIAQSSIEYLMMFLRYAVLCINNYLLCLLERYTQNKNGITNSISTYKLVRYTA